MCATIKYFQEHKLIRHYITKNLSKLHITYLRSGRVAWHPFLGPRSKTSIIFQLR